MSHICFYSGTLVYENWKISGMERGHMAALLQDLAGWEHMPANDSELAAMVNDAVDNEPKCRLIARMHAQCELGAWFYDTKFVSKLIRESCETAVHVPSRGCYAPLLRVGMSNYGRADLNRRGDRGHHMQTWWSLVDHYLALPRPPVAMYYSTSGRPWDEGLGGLRFHDWLKENLPHLEWRADNWMDWRAS